VTRGARGPAVLVVDDGPRTADLLARLLDDAQVVEVSPGRLHAESWSEAESIVTSGRRIDLVVLDLRFDLPDERLLPDRRPLGDTPAGRRDRRERRERQGLFILERLRRLDPDLPVVLTTAHEEIAFEEDALRLRADAFTYTVGDDETTGEGLARLVRRVLAERHQPLSTGRFFWGRTPGLRELRRRIGALAPTPLPLLLTGPTGSGKNHLVREVIHPLSGRKGPLVVFDCATVPETLVQAALFGVVRGAYTGAVADRAGVFEAAAGGTLFLDEIENLTADAQKSLLLALNDGVVRRVGAVADIAHTARIVAASNADLGKLAADGSFRTDLLMRLNPALALELPPLAERLDDLRDLADEAAGAFFSNPVHRRETAAQVRAAGGGAIDAETGFALVVDEDELARRREPVQFFLPGKAWKAVRRHPWPGNVRQFEMVLTDLLAASLYGRGSAALDRKGRVVFSLDPRLLFDLLREARGSTAASADALLLPRPKAGSVEEFRRELERSALKLLFREAKGDFERMAELMTGSAAEHRAVRLRFNRLGLSAKAER
jgi:DNA-binding NtrC family response regulator